jgi:bacterioferritin
MNTKEIISLLNEALAQEHACIIRYLTHAAVVKGVFHEPVKARLTEIATDEQTHAGLLRDRVVGLGGIPTTDVREIKMATDIPKILAINIEEEKSAITMYQNIHAKIPDNEVLLRETVEQLIRDEQEHLQELTQLTD